MVANREEFIRFVEDALDSADPSAREYWEECRDKLPRTFDELRADGHAFFEKKGVIFDIADDAPNIGGDFDLGDKFVVGRSYNCVSCGRTHPPGPCENFKTNPRWREW